MNKIQRTSHLFRILFQIGFVITIIAFIASWIFGSAGVHLGTSIKIGLSHFPQGIHVDYPVSFSLKFIAFFVDVIPTLLSLFILSCLIKLFFAYEKAELFALKNVLLIRNIGYALLIKEIFTPIHQFLLSFLFSGYHNAWIRLTGFDFGMIFLALLIILNSWIMAEGYKLRVEQQLTI